MRSKTYIVKVVRTETSEVQINLTLPEGKSQDEIEQLATDIAYNLYDSQKSQYKPVNVNYEVYGFEQVDKDDE